MIPEKEFKPYGGYLLLVILMIVLIGAALLFVKHLILLGAVLVFFVLLFSAGFFVNNPNESKVVSLFGKYVGTVKNNGFCWANPFYKKDHVSLRMRNLNGQTLKVNDKLGNPIEIAAVIVWQVEDTARAIFEVDDYVKFVNIQSEAAVRHLAGTCPYDNFEDADAVTTLRGGDDVVNDMLRMQLDERLNKAGIRVTEARISHLAYAPEIAGAMLQRQQATAIVAARQQIVEGAVGMVEMALEQLAKKQVVTLDEERKAAMVSNLLVVLCGDRNVSPVVNTGTLHN
ncbi:MAG: SPFH domain-containing protein [Bacteroidia bacterium]|nr:SPFH domain-containing protein [Bacteroidia bacterium]